MKRVLTVIVVAIVLLVSVSCTPKEQVPKDDEPGNLGKETRQEQTDPAAYEPANDSESEDGRLPDTYPKKDLPLAADAVIVEVKEDSQNGITEVVYVSENNIDTLRDFYEAILKDVTDKMTIQTEDGYMITAQTDNYSYTILLSENAMDNNPQYSGKISAWIVVVSVA